MSRLMLVLLLMIGTQGLFVVSCGGPETFKTPDSTSPSADESEGEDESAEDESSSDGDITTTPDTPITGEEIEPSRDPFDDEGTHWCGDCEGDVACEICMD